MKNPDDPTKAINTRLLRRMQRAILKWPAHFNINRWGGGFRWTPQTKTAPDCGMAACLAGWAVALGRPGGITRQIHIYGTAVTVLGLTHPQATDLFSSVGSRYGPAFSPRQAVARIDRFLAAMRKPG